MNLMRVSDVAVGRDGQIRRRDFFRGVSAAALAAGTLSWTDWMTVQADELRRRGKACILLWMQGAPSQFETFSPKPGHANGGETKAIETSVSGIQIAENLPNIARSMQDFAVLRSLTSKEGNHQRATFMVHTGYIPSASVKYPTLGSLVARELGDPQSELPSFVRIGGNFQNAGGGGLLGVDYDAFVLQNADNKPVNTATPTGPDRFQRRLGLLDRLESQFAVKEGKQEVADHKKLYAKTARMILSPRMEAFDISQEPDSLRDAYGRKPFASSCLLARRLIESGVTFVEVSLGNWDTHDNNFERTKQLCGQIDQPVAQLVADLKERGMLDSTLVLWMGEFGRTPRINPRSGRDHYPKAFNGLLAGGGIRGGQVIGQTDAGGSEVTDRPVTIQDLLQTVCKSLDIDPAKENMSAIGRPIKIVDGGQPVAELFG